jgi:hypothetical protein
MRSKPRPPDIAADPFRERSAPVSRRRLRLLGGTFEFECESPLLQRLVDAAFAGLPPLRLAREGRDFRVRLALAPRARRPRRSDAPRIDMLAGAGLLCASTSHSDFAVVSAEQRAALVVLSPRMLRFPYQARYELIEFVVFTLAARAQGLVPLHAACVGERGRGVLLMGDSGAGKTTAALHCLLQGLEFIAEDSVFVTPDSLLATGVANFLHVRTDSLASLPRATAAAIRRSRVIRRRSGVRKFEIDLRSAGFRLATTPLRIVAIVFISARTARTARLLTPLRRGAALLRLAATQGYAAHQPLWGRFKGSVGRIPVVELRRGRHAGDAVTALRSLLAGAAVPRR